MRMLTIETSSWPKQTVAIHPRTAIELSLPSSITLSFGVRKERVKVHLNESVEEWVFSLSHDVRDGLLIPLSRHFEWKQREDEFVLGPFIAFYAGEEDRHALRRIKGLRIFTEHYHHINGTLFCFSAEGVDKETNAISGYVYEPLSNTWKKATCGYPSVLYRNVLMKEDFRQDFIQKVGKKIINEKVIGKWEMHKILSASKELGQYMPKTKLCKSPRSLFQMLKTESTVYLKPINGLMGSGIIKVRREGGKLLLSYRQKKKLVEKTMTPKEAALFFRRRLSKEDYLVQQGLDIQHDGRLIDFRVMVVKDSNGEWKAMGFVGKSVSAKEITSNWSTGGDVADGGEVLRQLVGLTIEEAAEVTERMKSIAVKIGEVLDATGDHFANLGIDIAIDTSGDIWIIEVNHRGPGLTILKYAGFEAQYKNILKTIMLYAKRLAGF